MNEFKTVGMCAASADELEQVGGGFVFALGVLAGVGSVLVGIEIGKALNGGHLGSALAGVVKKP